jgi:hypothetical protein
MLEQKSAFSNPILAFKLNSKAVNMLSLAFQMATQKNFARSAWLLLLNMGSKIDTFFSDIDVPVNSELFVAHRPLTDVQLTEVYRVRKGYPLQKHEFGALSARDNVLKATNVKFYTRRSNLQGLPMQVVTVEVRASQLLGVSVPRRYFLVYFCVIN